MTAYATLDDLSAAYIAHSNARYADPITHVTPDDVRAICVTPLLPLVARTKGVPVTKIT